MTCTRLLSMACLLVAMTTGVLSNTRANTVCGDDSGFNCLYKTNIHEYTDVPVQFDNKLPHWLNGTLMRNGLGMFERGQQSVTHVFDGFAKLSSWKFLPNGTTLFSTRFIGSSFFKESMNEDHLEPYLLFNPPSPPFTYMQRMEGMVRGIDNMNINIIDVPATHNSGGTTDFIAVNDYWRVYQVSGRDLSTKGLVKPSLRGGRSVVHLNILASAHPLPEPGTKNKLTFLVRRKTLPFFKNRLSLVRMSSVSGRSLIAEWKIRDTIPYMHSFSVTQTKVIFLTGPMVVDEKCLLEKAAPLPCMDWHEGKPSVLYIVDLKSGQKRTIKMTSSLFAIHHINAFDLTDDVIVMDVSSYDTPEVFKKISMMDIMLNEEKRNSIFSPPMNRRVYINFSTNDVKIQDMSTKSRVADGLDMPAINERYRSKKYCYVYGLTVFADGRNFSSSSITKKDMCRNGHVVGSLLIDYHYPVEPVFIPNPHARAEDDGVLLVPFLRGEDAVTYLAVVDAQTMAITSKADMPDYLPFTLHGRFIQDFY